MIKALAMVMVLAAVTTAHADPENDMRGLAHVLQDSWGRDSDTHAWLVNDADAGLGPPRCAEVIEKLKGQPDSLTMTFAFDAGDLAAGTHTLGEGRKSCEHIARLGKVKAVEAQIELAMRDSPKLDGNDFDFAQYRICMDLWDAAVKAGMSPSEQVPERKVEDPKTHKPFAWKGTIESLKKTWCDPGFAKAQEKIAKKEAPYRAVLKHDKLEMALEDPFYLMSGGRGTSKPGDLAAASVWFRDVSPDRTCPGNGKQVHTLHRYQFDGTGKLTKSTDKDFCGEIPGSAYR